MELDPTRMRVNLEVTDGLIGSEAVMLTLGDVIGRQRAHDVVSDAARVVGRRRAAFRRCAYR